MEIDSRESVSREIVSHDDKIYFGEGFQLLGSWRVGWLDGEDPDG